MQKSLVLCTLHSPGQGVFLIGRISNKALEYVAHLWRSSLRSMVLPPLPVTGRVSLNLGGLVAATCHTSKEPSSIV